MEGDGSNSPVPVGSVFATVFSPPLSWTSPDFWSSCWPSSTTEAGAILLCVLDSPAMMSLRFESPRETLISSLRKLGTSAVTGQKKKTGGRRRDGQHDLNEEGEEEKREGREERRTLVPIVFLLDRHGREGSLLGELVEERRGRLEE